MFPRASVGLLTDVHDSAQVPVGTRRVEGVSEYIYLQGVASTVAGSWVTYDEVYTTALLAANAVGDVAVAMAAIVANKFGWYCIKGKVSAMLAANCADNSGSIGREGADGEAGDGRAAGDAIIGAVSRGSTAGAAALTAVQINYPLVNDATGV